MSELTDLIAVLRKKTGPILLEDIVNLLNAKESSGTIAATNVSFTPAGNIAATTVQAALEELDAEKAKLASPTFTGNPAAPTASAGDNDTSIATSAFVQGEINDRVRCWILEILDPVVGRYSFARAPGFAGTIQSLTHITNQGTVTGDVEINGTDVTSLNAIGADSSETTTAATGANNFTSGQRIEWNCTAVAGGPQKVTLTLTYKRTGTE